LPTNFAAFAKNSSSPIWRSSRIASASWRISSRSPDRQTEGDRSTELDLLKRIEGVFDTGQGAASLGLKGEEEKAIRSFQLLR